MQKLSNNSRSTLQKISPIFDRKFLYEQLDKSTIFQLKNKTLIASGPNCMSKFVSLTGKTPSTDNFSFARVNDKVIKFASPIKSVTGQEYLEIENYEKNDVNDEWIKVESNEEFIKRAFQNNSLTLMQFPEIRFIVNGDNEEVRRRKLRELGLGTGVLYNGWADEIDECLSLLGSGIPSIHPENRIAALKIAIKNHVEDKRRSLKMPLGIHVAINGTPNSGKTSLLKVLSQKTEVGDEEVVNLSGIPVLVQDTNESNQENVVGSADLKIFVLDMKDVYENLNKEIFNSIDSDTIILLNKCDSVSIRKPEGPAKIRMKNGPLNHSIPKNTFKGVIPLRLDGDTKGNFIDHGDYGLRVLNDIRMTEKCLKECRTSLHRHLKKVKGGRFWMKVFPDHPTFSKPLGVRMGKGKGSFDHWVARVPNKTIVFEIGGGVREDIAREVFRVVASKVPGPTEFVKAPVMESEEDFIERLYDSCKVKPVGIFPVSLTSKKGLTDMISKLSSIVNEMYVDIPENKYVDPVSKKHYYSTLSLTCLENGDLEGAKKNVSKLINDRHIISESLKYMFHENYGILKKNKMQIINE